MIIYLAIRLSFKYNFLQFKFRKIIRTIKIKNNNKISPVDSLCVSLGAKIGVGSLSGVALSIYYGGIGSIFWLLIISLIVAINSYMECKLGIRYRIKDGDNYIGGPSYYITKALNDRSLGLIYAFLVVVAYGGVNLSIQANTIINITDIFDIKRLYAVISLMVITFLIVKKGILGVAKVSSKLVPIMLFIYFLLGLYTLISNISLMPNLFINMIKSAFNIRSIIPVFLVGMQRAIFITESSIGTSAIAASISSNDADSQGMLEIFGIYITIFMVAFMTFIMIDTAKYNINIGSINGIEIVMMAFKYHFGIYGQIFLSIITVLFAFSTIITSYYFGNSNINIFKNRLVKEGYIFIFMIILFISCYFKANILWNLIDYLMALLVIVNIYAIIRILYKNNNFGKNNIGE